MNRGSCRRLVSAASVWRMGVPTTVIAWVNIKKMIFHMANSITMLAFYNLLLLLRKRSGIWNSWRWNFIKKYGNLKFDGLGVVWNMKGKLLVISKTSSLLVMDKLFPRFDDGLGRCRLDVCFCMQICYYTGHWMWINGKIIDLLLIGIYFNFLNRNKFRMMTPLL